MLRIIRELKTNTLKRSIFVSVLCKPVGMLISFLYTPILLAYLGDESYGIWSTLMSIINWINYFDIGIGQGLRNALAKYIANNDQRKAKQSVSTGYIALTVIAIIAFFVGIGLIFITDLNTIFKTSVNLRSAFIVSFSCICINFILGLSKSQLYATQQAEKVSIMVVLTQAINLLGILVLSVFRHRSLLGVAIVIGFSGLLVNLIFTRMIWKKYSFLVLNFKYYCSDELKNICNTGLKFFFVQIAALVLYSTDNIIITQLFGPSYVTPYHTSYTAFGIVNGLFGAMISPLWSKYTIALEKGDFIWIKKTIFSLNKLLPFVGIILMIEALFFDSISRIWLHKELIYESGLIVCMAIYYFLTIWGSIYATVLNGMGKINMQLALGIGSAMLNIPLSIFLGKSCNLGTTGVCLATVICMLISNIPITINTHIYLNRRSKEY